MARRRHSDDPMGRAASPGGLFGPDPTPAPPAPVPDAPAAPDSRMILPAGTYNALSLWEPYASMIADGVKTLETRMWEPDPSYYGPMLICTTKDHGDMGFYRPKIPSLPGHAICLVELYGSRLMTQDDVKAACCDWEPKRKVLLLRNIRRIVPIPVKGEQMIFQVTIT